MKMFIISVAACRYDEVDSIAVLAETQEKAMKFAIEYDDIFRNNISDVEEIDLSKEGIVHESVKHG